MKRSLIALVSILVVAVAALLVVPSFFDWNQYKPQAVQAIKDKTGLDVSLNGDVRVALLPAPYAYINDVVVKSPKSKKYDALATLGRLDLHLAVAPLLSGKVDFTSIELVKPVINIETLADGTPSWKTEEIAALMGGKDDAADKGDASAQGGAGADMMSSISLNKVDITEGALALYNEKTASEQVIDNVTAQLKAETLSGPFTIDGSVQNAGRAIKINAKTGRLGGDSGSVPLNVSVKITPDNIDLVYSGIVETGENFAVQGETKLTVQNLAETLSSFGAASPVLKSAALNAQGLLTADAEKFSFENSAITLGDSQFSGSIGGTVSPMTLNLDLKSNKLNLGSAFDIPELTKVKTAAISGTIAMKDGAIEAKNLNVKLDETQVKGAVVYASAGARPKLQLAVQSDNLDLNKFMQVPAAGTSSPSAAGGKGGSGDVKKSLEAINIPMDMDIDANIAKGKYGAYTIDGLVAKAGVSGNAIKIGTLSAKNFAGATLDLQGNIADYKALKGVDIHASLSTKDIKALGNALAIDLTALPQGLDALDLRTQAKGSAEAMDVTANIKAMGGEVIASGNVGDVLNSMKISALDLQLKHPNFNQALNTIQPGAGSFDDLNKPLDFFAHVAMQNGGYTLSDIKANVSGIPVTGSAGIDMSGAKPDIKGDLRLGDVKIGNKAAGGKAAAATQGNAAPAAQSAGWSRETMESGWMNAMNFDVKLAASSINYQGWAMAQPSMKAVLKNGTLTLEQLQTGLYDGQLNLQGVMKPANGDKGYNINGVANLRDVSLEPLVGSLTGNRILTGKGLISTDTEIKTAGLSPSALVNALGGKGSLTGKEIVLTGFDLARFARALSSETKPGDTLLGVWKGATKGGSTSFDTLDGDFTINEGIVNISSVKMDGPKAYMDTTGKIDIPQFTITTKHSITLKEEDIPPFDINISGPLNNPGQTFGQGVLNDYISRKVNRKVEDLITDKFGDKLGLTKKQPDVVPVVPAVNTGVDGVENTGAGNEGQAVESQVEEAPAAEEQPQERSKKEETEEAIKGLLKGLMQ